MKRYIQRIRFVPAVAVIVVITLALSAYTFKDEQNYYYKVNRGLETFGQVYREISGSYVDEIDPDAFISAGIEGMLGMLDPYTVYLKKQEAADINMLTSGSYGGIGIRVGMRDSLLTIIDVVDGHSAHRQGLRIGDVIQSIDGSRLIGGPLDTLREFTRGAPNTTLQITVLRQGVDEPLDFTLVREDIEVNSVSYSELLDGGIGYIRLDRFSATAGDEVRRAVMRFRRQGGLNGVILDLRDNPGGLLESAVDVSARFVPAGSTIVTTRGRTSGDERVYRSTEVPVAGDVPLAVLLNESSASASEIVAGAVQDLDRGIILGTRSFGKGLVQSVRRLSHDASLKVTTARYYTPSGRCIQRIDYSTGRPVQSDSMSYTTRNGRPVRGGGGILPDTVVVLRTDDTLLERLRTSTPFFRFVTRLAAPMTSLPEDYRIDDATLNQLERYMIENSASLASEGSALSAANELYRRAERENAPGSVLHQIDVLRDELARQQLEPLRTSRETVRQMLADEVAARFLTQRGRLERSLASDAQVRAAMAILRSSPGAYSRLVGVGRDEG